MLPRRNNKRSRILKTRSLLCFLFSAHSASSAKQLVLFAGPHQSGSSSVEKFYHNHASGYNNARTAKGLDGWLWPRVDGDLNQGYEWERHKVFQFLVTRTSDENVQNQLNSAIESAYTRSKEGILIGTEEFDHIGKNLTSGLDSLKRMKEIVNRLHVDQEDVWIIFNYRTPRVDQYISYWKHYSETNYRKWLCFDYESRWEMVETALNPLGLVHKIRKETGWNVVLIDLIGVQDAGADASHVIACEILGNTDCRNSFVSDRYNKTYHLNEVEKDLNSIGEDKIEELEILFRQRDCYYKEKLENDHAFHVLHDSTLWQGCSPDHNDIYEQLADTTVLLDLIRSQKDCNDLKGHKMVDFLVGDYSALTYKKEVEKLKQDDAATEFENLENLERDEKKREKKEDNGELTEEEQYSFIFPILFLTFVCVGIVKYMGHKKKRTRHHLWDRPNYRPGQFDLDAEFGVTENADSDKEELEMPQTTYSDWRYADEGHKKEVDRQVKTNRALMQMPRRKISEEDAEGSNSRTYDGFDLTWAVGEADSSDDDSDESYKDEY